MEKAKSSLSTGANIFYFIKLLFKISPLLVIGEALSGIFTALPTRLIAVIGAKYVADTVESGSNARQNSLCSYRNCGNFDCKHNGDLPFS